MRGQHLKTVGLLDLKHPRQKMTTEIIFCKELSKIRNAVLFNANFKITKKARVKLMGAQIPRY